MKKGDRVNIKKDAKKFSEGYNCWSEDITGTATIKAGTKLYHTSRYDKIEAFATEVTCLSEKDVIKMGYIYEFEFIKDIECVLVDDDEYRIELEEDIPINIIYLGTAKSGNKVIVDKCGRKGTWNIVYSLSDKKLAKKWNKESLDEMKKYVNLYSETHRIEQI